MFLSDSDQTGGGKNIYKNSKGNVDTEEIMLNETKANEVWLFYRRLVLLSVSFLLMCFKAR